MKDIDKAIEEAKAELLPFASWEKLPGESGAAHAAFFVDASHFVTGGFAVEPGEAFREGRPREEAV
jgi:hypothetical protein